MTQRALTGFFVGLFVFVAINLTSAHLSSDCGLPAVFGRDSCADDVARAGWPVRFYEEGGFNYRFNFSIGKLAMDIGIGILLASTIGWLFTRRAK